MREACVRVLTDTPREALQYAASEGYGPLRDWVAAQLGSQGMKVEAAQVLITTGSQQGLDLVGKVLIDAGSRVAVEAPTYLGALQAFTPYEPEFVAVDCDEQGPVPSALALSALLAIGATGYGLSLRFYLLAQRAFGAARTGSVFAFAPFIGAAFAVLLGERPAGWMMAAGIVAVLAGIMLILKLPSSAAWAIGLMVGISMISAGWAYLSLALRAGRVAKAIRETRA